MKGNFFRKTIIGLLTVIFAFAFSGCGLFDSVNGGDNHKPAVYISQNEITLAVGNTVQLHAVSTDGSAVVWESSNSGIATVADGLVTGVSKGEAVIMASTDSVMAVCTIKVTGAVVAPPHGETLVLSLAELSLEVGDTVKLVAKSSVDGAEIIWDSSNKTVANVAGGIVTAHTAGKTTITANTGTAVASCEITVTDKDLQGLQKPGYKLVWNDEFNGNSLDTQKWNYQTGTRDIYHGYDTQVWNWGNGELQYYTQDSVRVSDGSLIITASKQSVEDREYKSGRILTRDLASWTYGYFEAKIKTPTGDGMWPAFWMLPQPSTYANVENKYGGWPYNGEIDIMEARGRLQNVVDTTLHFGPVSDGTWQSDYKTSSKTLSSNTDRWHTYAVDWTPTYIAWIIDGTETFRVSSNHWYSRSAAADGNESAPFDQPFYIILNLAVGGQYDGGVAPSASFGSASMYVDYVRVYEKA
ncbi:MAG: family 16 glycosylhydrolase [Clostridia bacterium]|nr:family 16 glycosylhydrolase [Clostridia bacterium]